MRISDWSSDVCSSDLWSTTSAGTIAGGENAPIRPRFANRCGRRMSTTSSSNTTPPPRSPSNARIAQLEVFSGHELHSGFIANILSLLLLSYRAIDLLEQTIPEDVHANS